MPEWNRDCDDRGYYGDVRGYDRGREFAGDFGDFGRGGVPGGAGPGAREPHGVQYDREDRAFDPPPRRPSFRGRGPKNYRRSDERLRELVSERLEDHEAIDASDMEVEVRDGVVTLTGTIDSRRTKRLAEDVALITTGVRDVQNALKIDPGFFGRMAERVREAVQGE